MSISEIAAAVIGLRETTYKDHQRLSGSVDEMRGAVEGMRGAIDEILDKRLAHAAQAFRDVEKRLETEYERRIEAMLMTVIEVVDRLAVLVDTAATTEDPGELQSRLRSCAAPRDRLQQVLEEAGVRAFASVGEPYDPHRHEVVRRETVPDCQREYVLQELRPGYVRAGTDHTLIRAKVIVAAPPVMEGGADE